MLVMYLFLYPKLEEVEKLSHNDVTKQEHLNYRIVNRQGGNIHRGGELLDSNNAQEYYVIFIEVFLF